MHVVRPKESDPQKFLETIIIEILNKKIKKSVEEPH
jgi:hypothetical protein